MEPRPRHPAAIVGCLLIVFMIVLNSEVFGLSGVRMWNPEAIRAGESLHLSCDYNLEGTPLYSIKWYFGDEEFYRYVPKESPPTRVFPLSGTASVDISESDDHAVTMNNLPRDMSGHYKCEVSADAPLFHTQIKESFITIIEEPKSPPIVFAGKLKYSKGEPIAINCTSYSGFPATNLTWYINDVKVTSMTKHVVIKSRVLTEPGGMQTSKSRLETVARPIYFPGGRMIVRCESSQFELYKKYTVTELVDDSPKIAQMMSPSTVLGAGGPQINSANYLVTRNALLLITILANQFIPFFSR
ncbi:uncharacterized protein LOC126901121 [Daktulosphaira vitifoliae]|uniref:uncharacterized protein LOC126901121 n=1 Tax=Daktulosphaira vitifoliae TaxID=58002 RepID=UPI0021AA2D62|nr:uncharacterized protein LOC126901121 [Daktulosphaira vitifoliae]